MTAVDELVRYDGKHVVVTGCASGIGAQVARQVAELGGRVTGLDLRAPADGPGIADFIEVDLSDTESIDRAAVPSGVVFGHLFGAARGGLQLLRARPCLFPTDHVGVHLALLLR